MAGVGLAVEVALSARPDSEGTLQTVRIDSLGAGGVGVGRLEDGRVVFVPGTLPEERVTVRVTRVRSRWAEAERVAIEAASPRRVDPPCPLFDSCGGCALQHAPYDMQLEAKRRWVSDALARIGGVDVDVPPVVASTRPFGYRRKMSFHLLRLAGGRVIAGLHERSTRRIIDVHDECLLPTPQLGEAWQALRSGWGTEAERLPAGRRLRLTLVAARSGVTLVVEGGRGRGDPVALLEAAPELASYWLRRTDGTREHLAGAATVPDRIFGTRVALRGDAFVQADREGAEAVYAHVCDVLGPVSGARVVEAYAGHGVLARRLAREGARVTAIEIDPAADHASGEDVRVLVGDVADRLAEALPADVVLVNPPRTGLSQAVSARLGRSGVERIVYVSCDAGTLARDLARLGPYEVRGVRCFDLFPQTPHVETVVELAREDGGAEA